MKLPASREVSVKIFGAPFASRRFEISRARVCVYFARPTIAIAKIRDYSQSTRGPSRARELSLLLRDELLARVRPMLFKLLIHLKTAPSPATHTLQLAEMLISYIAMYAEMSSITCGHYNVDCRPKLTWCKVPNIVS